MKVIQVLPSLISGGVERGTVEIANALVAAGHESHVVSEGGRLVKQLTQSGSEHHTLQVGQKRLSTLLTARRLRELVQKVQPDIVHPRSRLPAWLCYRALKKDRSKYQKHHLVTSVHGLYSVSKYSGIVTKGELIEVVSKTTEDYLCANYKIEDLSRIRRIFRGIDPTKYHRGFVPSADWWLQWEADIAELEYEVEGPLLILPGRISRLKGHTLLLDLVKRLDAEAVPVRALIVGDAGDHAKSFMVSLKERIVNDPTLLRSIRFMPHRNDLREIMSTGDIVLSLSAKPEAFGRTVLESLSLGTPVVGISRGGVGELLAQIYPQGASSDSVETLARTVVDVLQRAEPIADHNFTLQRMCSLTLELYSELVSV